MSQYSQNCPEDIGNSTKESETTAPRIGEFNDPFEYAPKRPDGDHWEILLRPLLEGDKAQCNIWKDEVSNLLIFAGLFSGVVTAFIIESYKSLQRDPKQDMITLLSQMVVRLGNNTSVASSQPFDTLPTFSPTTSSIRINIFWFISLILSLTTVLVGIISLQWLREHQNYATLSPRQQYAIFHIRREGLEKWHVGKVFTAMPLLLQSALVLFFTGIIDFLLAFGDIAVVIPVAVVIGLTLLFLVATTLLPTLQGFYLFFNFSTSRDHRNIPVQCPYKSPQSDAIRAITLPIFNLLEILYPHLLTISHRIQPWFNRTCFFIAFGIRTLSTITSCARNRKRYVPRKLHLANSRTAIHKTFIRHIDYSDRTWLAFDLQWLAIRDGFMRRAFNRPLEEYEQLRHDPEYSGRVPIWDILQGLVSQTHPNISSAYHAYMEVSDMEVSDSDNSNAYLYDAVAYGSRSSKNYVCFHDFYEDISRHVNYRPLAKYQALYKFVHRIAMQIDHSDTMLQHMGEIYLRLMEYLFTHNIPVRPQHGQDFWPDCLVANHNFFNTTGLQVMLLQLIMTLFVEMSKEYTRNALVNLNSAQQNGIGVAITCWRWVSFYSKTTDHQVQRAISSLFDVINEILDQELHTIIIPLSGNARATLLFHAAAIFARQFIHEPSGHVWQPSLETLLSTIRHYKSLTIDIGMSDSDIENQLYHWGHDSSTFSADWWSRLLQYVPLSESSIINDISHINAQPSPLETVLGENSVLVPPGAEPYVSGGPTDLIPE